MLRGNRGNYPPVIPPKGGFSFILPIGYSDSSHCGYCHGQGDNKRKKRFSYYASCESLSPYLYQALIDRCWRRSGTLLYRPNQKDMCCPHYTLRLDADNFHATRDQRQATNRFNRFVIGDTYAKEAAILRPRSREEAKRRETVFVLTERIHEAESNRLPPLTSRKRVSTKMQTDDPPSAAGGADTTDTANVTMALEPTRPAHCFEVTLEHDTFTEEKFAIYENYQRVIHGETSSRVTRQGFASFLCDSPLRRETAPRSDGKGMLELGSFHQCYRLDGRLVAVSVLDLLPHSVSAVYFFYHESIHQYSPGKLSALREIALAHERGYRWWYSGYYIHGCPKMRYKIDYAPQYVLDPEIYQWDLLDEETLAIFDSQPYVSLSEERRLLPEEQFYEDEEDEVEGYDEHSTYYGEGSYEESDVDSVISEDTIPLMESNMPGLPPKELIDTLNMDGIPVQTNMDLELVPISMLSAWSSEVRDNGVTFKGRVAELAAAIGPDLLGHVCLDFRTHKKKKY